MPRMPRPVASWSRRREGRETESFHRLVDLVESGGRTSRFINFQQR